MNDYKLAITQKEYMDRFYKNAAEGKYAEDAHDVRANIGPCFFDTAEFGPETMREIVADPTCYCRLLVTTFGDATTVTRYSDNGNIMWAEQSFAQQCAKHCTFHEGRDSGPTKADKGGLNIYENAVVYCGFTTRERVWRQENREYLYSTKEYSGAMPSEPYHDDMALLNREYIEASVVLRFPR